MQLVFREGYKSLDTAKSEGRGRDKWGSKYYLTSEKTIRRSKSTNVFYSTLAQSALWLCVALMFPEPVAIHAHAVSNDRSLESTVCHSHRA